MPNSHKIVSAKMQKLYFKQVDFFLQCQGRHVYCTDGISWRMHMRMHRPATGREDVHSRRHRRTHMRTHASMPASLTNAF